jgi:large repetitive protein
LAIARDPLPVVRNLETGMNANTFYPFPLAFFIDAFTSPETNAMEAIRIDSLPAHGQLQLAGRNLRVDDEVLVTNLPSITYTPDRDYIGWDGWTWNGRDYLFYAPTNSQFHIYVTAPPVPGPDAVQGLQNTEVCYAIPDLLRNDSDADGGVLRVPSVPLHSQQGGTVTLFGAIAYYTPAPNFTGSDVFNYYLSDSQGGIATGVVSVAVLAAPVVKTAAPVLNTINGYFYQTNRITNPLTNPICGTMAGVRLYFSNFPLGGQLVNPSGTGTNGLPFLVSTNPLAPGQSVDLVAAFSVTNRVAPSNIVLTTQVLSPGAAAGTNSTLRVNQVSKRADGNFFIEFTTDIGRGYQILYSSNLRDWTPVTGVLIAPSRHVQWIDDFPPPMTGMAGAGTNRFYRVLLLNP